MRAPLVSLVLVVVALFVVACGAGDGAPPRIAWAQPPAPGTCTEWNGQPIERSCLPRTAMSHAPLVLEIEERCGRCGTSADRCTVTVEGRVVNLSLDGKTCEPVAGAVCKEACVKRRVRCDVPPLEVGRYLVRYGDSSGHVDSLDVVPSREAASGCTLDDGSSSAPPSGG